MRTAPRCPASARRCCPHSRPEPRELPRLLERLAALVVVELVDLDVLRAGRRRCTRRTPSTAGRSRPSARPRTAQARPPSGPEQRRRSRTASRTPLDLVAVRREVADQLEVRLGLGDRGRPPEVAEERHVTAAAPPRSEGARAATASAIPPPWLPPATATRPGSTRSWRRSTSSAPPRRRRRAGSSRCAGPRSRGSGNPAAPARTLRVGGRSGGPAAALAAGVDHEVRVAGGRPEHVLVRQPAPAVVALVLHDPGQRARPAARAQAGAATRGPGRRRSRQKVTSYVSTASRPGVDAHVRRTCTRAVGSVADQNSSRSARPGRSGA